MQQFAVREANVRVLPVRGYSDRICIRDANPRRTYNKMCKQVRVAAILLKSGVPILCSEISNLTNHNFSRGDFKKRCVGGPQFWFKLCI
jgi:hypothetical protein